MTPDHPFTIEHYGRILAAVGAAGFRYSFFHEMSHPIGRRLYLRHDIDNDVAMAYRLALVEAQAGAHATYLVMLRSANYNVAEKRNVLHMRQIAAMGHEVGLHFSLIDHPDEEAELVPLIQRDARTLEDLLGLPVRVFGFHNPSEPTQYKVDVPGLVNTYASQFFDEALYISESNMRWRTGCPCETLRSSARDAVQLLVHPLSYAADLSSDRDVLLHFLDLRLTDLLEYNVAQNRVLRESGLSRDDVVNALQQRRSAR
ncbi:MAG: hypothetical protein JNM79_05790 [Burkholderiales bacterium]|nr:hypothetical protein [Burkholderiales bacterium]